MCVSLNAVELLVVAKPSELDSWDESKITSLSIKDKKKYDARITEGDILLIKPDGWIWGSEERLPNYIVFKIPGLSLEESKKYAKAISVIIEENGVSKDDTTKERKYFIDPIEILQAKNDGVSIKVISLDKIAEFKDKKIKEKT